MFPGFLFLCGAVSIEYVLVCKKGEGTHLRVLSLDWLPYGIGLMEGLALPLWPLLRLFIINLSHLYSLGMSKTNIPPRLVEYSGTMFNSASKPRPPHLLYAISPRNKISSPSLQAKRYSPLLHQVLSHYFSPSFQKFLLSQLYLHNILETHLVASCFCQSLSGKKICLLLPHSFPLTFSCLEFLPRPFTGTKHRS